jgi:branched-chain amino acid transport system substrate-binding protein
MRKHMTVFTIAIVALMLAAPSAGAKTIKIGFEGPLSGSQRSNGLDMYRGTLLAVEEINKMGGLGGARLALVKIDDRANPDLAVPVANAAIRKGIFAVVGPYNSSVGLRNLLAYLNAGVVPLHMTSTDDTAGYGVTVQPKNSQISPVEVAAIKATGVSTVAMLVDPSTYTQGMADRLAQALTGAGISVVSIPIAEGKESYASELAQALSSNPELLYVSTYFPEGAKIARELDALPGTTRCFMGLANQDPAFVAESGISAAQRCQFSGVPTPQQFRTAKARAYVKAYRKRFGATPGTWGSFTYDSVYTLANAVRRAGGWDTRGVFARLKTTKKLSGVTGPITIDAATGNRLDVPVAILRVDASGAFIVERIVR